MEFKVGDKIWFKWENETIIGNISSIQNGICIVHTKSKYSYSVHMLMLKNYPKTHLDALREMSAEEMAILIYENTKDCTMCIHGDYSLCGTTGFEKNFCVKGMIDYLNSPVEAKEGDET